MIDENAAAGFSAAWLLQREPFDLAARSAALAAGLQGALQALPSPWRITDLASGSGANFRALAPLLDGDQTWRLIDHDPQLLAAQRTEIGQWAARHGWHCQSQGDGLRIDTGRVQWQVRGQPLDLAQDLETLDLIDCDALVTTAFLDLVSADWLDRLATLLARTPRPLLATLNVDGRRAWHPAHAADGLITEAFLSHQTGDKGFGPSLGVRAAPHLAERLSASGFWVKTETSDWAIGPAHPAMLQTMAEEAAHVARQAAPAQSRDIQAWLNARLSDLAQGRLGLTIGHLDLLSLPCQHP